jgi:hypothetical protein
MPLRISFLFYCEDEKRGAVSWLSCTRLDSMYSCPGRYSPLQSFLMFGAEFVQGFCSISSVGPQGLCVWSNSLKGGAGNTYMPLHDHPYSDENIIYSVVQAVERTTDRGTNSAPNIKKLCNARTEMCTNNKFVSTLIWKCLDRLYWLFLIYGVLTPLSTNNASFIIVNPITVDSIIFVGINFRKLKKNMASCGYSLSWFVEFYQIIFYRIIE